MKRLLLCASLLLSAAALANPYETRLANGLRIIVKEDHRAPTAVQMVWYRAGSMDERDGTSGVAHVLEHMMFKGTQKVGPGEFSRRVAAAGGRDNAFTSLDYTAYFQQVPQARLGEMMALEADRMAHLKLDAKEFASEIKVVMEERRMRTEDEPIAKVHEALRAAAFVAHPYHRPIIGWMDDLEHMTWRDAQDWYRTWYNPANAYVVIVGDVDHQQVFRLAERHFGPLKAPQTQPERKPRNEPPQEGPRRVVVKAPAKLPYVALAWKVPKLKDVERDREPYALEVLATLLDGHDAARFPRHLVRERKIAQSAGAGYDGTLRGEALFTLGGQPAEGHTAAELEAALRAEVARIAREGVTAEELARVKVQTIASQVYKRDSMMGQAMEIGHAEASGFHWRDIDRMLEKIRSVSAEEVRAVAAKYFGDDTLTVATLDPLPLEQAQRPAAPAAGHHH
ncbi:peptidase M16 [Denitratisoma sp. DHT3]|uniref:M16 family metallopeptidase n=1 Tax=Denitratisoma sp. DHT3 TaxID=1981880 RepID=UPI0011986B85|nr:pitrilysin family protein [Denitratisoma sp. DHT3]QDX82030.1 peptidase M16 [Denitratisoma sp. DHT3]